jgi:hypothetical protein
MSLFRHAILPASLRSSPVSSSSCHYTKPSRGSQSENMALELCRSFGRSQCWNNASIIVLDIWKRLAEVATVAFNGDPASSKYDLHFFPNCSDGSQGRLALPKIIRHLP